MGEMRCSNISIKEFNQSAKANREGVTVLDQDGDGIVGERDLFIQKNRDGGSHVLKMNNPSIQGIYKFVCAERAEKQEEEARVQKMKDELAHESWEIKPKHKMVADAFGVRLGAPLNQARCSCDQYGVFDKDDHHLFDVHSDKGKNTISSRLMAARFHEKGLAPTRDAVKSGAHPVVTKLIISKADRKKLEDAGCSFDEARMRIRFPKQESGKRKGMSYFDPNSPKESITITMEDKAHIRVNFKENDGSGGSLIIEIKSGEIQ